MTRFHNPTDGISQEALAGLVAEAVQQALVQHGIALDTQALASAGAIAGSIAAALTFLSPMKQLTIETVKGTALATEFVQWMTDKAARRESAFEDPAFAAIDESTSTANAGNAVSALSGSLPGEWALQSMLIEDWAGEVAGSTYLEEKFRIPRSTLHRWQRRSEVIALRKGGRKHVFPLAQFVDGRPAAGISEVLSAIANPRLAWFWLNRAAPELGGRVPIEMLKHDMVQEVVLAARDFSPT